MRQIVCLFALLIATAPLLGADRARPRGEGTGIGGGERAEMRDEIRAEIRKFVKEMQERRRDHFMDQQKENEEFRKSMKGKDVSAILAALKTHRNEQFEENKTFGTAQQEKRVKFIQELGSKYSIPQERVDRALALAEERFADAVKHFEQQHEENIALFDKLAGQEGLTVEALIKTLEEHFKKQHEENKAFYEQLRKEMQDAQKQH